MRLQNSGRPIHIEFDDNLPVLIVFNGRELRVTSINPVEFVQSRWWLNWTTRGEQSRVYRVSLHERGGHAFQAEITRHGAVWTLTKILD